jgi:dsDNA-binding SOS-regulon protein
MAKYKVTYEEVSVYSIEIEAESYDEAFDIAHELDNPLEHPTMVDEGSHLDFMVHEPPNLTD